MQNPILPGFNPDPAICRSGNDYYIATSSFQWWPGVPIYHSRDLKHWQLVSYGLTDPVQVDLRRIGDSAGIWAPSLTYADGLFWLVFTIASGSRLHSYECRNFLTTAPDVRGPWSEPVYLNATGNDPALFHDDDGRKWLANTQSNWTPGGPAHTGVLLQEYSPEQRRLVGPVKNVFRGTELGTPEGSKLHKHKGWYYLMIAEGGTEYGHAMTVARSRSIWGPYELHPGNPVLTARHDPHNPIQRAGHGDVVTVDADRVALVYLASRPTNRKSLLGRETFLAGARWGEDGWLWLDSVTPQAELPDLGLPELEAPAPPAREEFDESHLALHWNSLRAPLQDLVDLTTRPGWLCLRPTTSMPDSIERPALLARRLLHHRFSAETLLDFQPSEPQQWAGLICYYDTRRWYLLHRQYDEQAGPCVALYTKHSRSVSFVEVGRTPIDDVSSIRLGVDCDGMHLHFRFAAGADDSWQAIGEPQDALILSDEHVEKGDPIPTFGFTGAFIGFFASDISETGPCPAYDWFSYQAY